MVKKGDTLIEVTLAVGIFSMIAIAIVAVMSGGTSGAQSSLETTLTRQEIDTQAEALRFIHSSYIADRDSNNENLTYVQLWKSITQHAYYIDKNTNEDERNRVLKFNPSSCKAHYDEFIRNGANAFIINPRALGNLKTTVSGSGDQELRKAYVSVRNGSDSCKFQEAQTYPHLISSTAANNCSSSDTNPSNSDDSGLTSNFNADQLFRAEGIYVLAVKDSGTTMLSHDYNSKESSAFYDFYIRACWYGTDAEEPSTISTVIRLYDPDAVAEFQTD